MRIDRSSFHYFNEPPQFIVNLPKPIRGELRRIGDTFIGSGHLLVPNVRCKGAGEKSPIAIVNCIR